MKGPLTANHPTIFEFVCEGCGDNVYAFGGYSLYGREYCSSCGWLNMQFMHPSRTRLSLDEFNEIYNLVNKGEN